MKRKAGKKAGLNKFGRKPDFEYEMDCWQRGYRVVIGVDEVGRGALAGPVVAGAVTLKNRIKYSEKHFHRRGVYSG